jgi:hypothetical protein
VSVPTRTFDTGERAERLFDAVSLSHRSSAGKGTYAWPAAIAATLRGTERAEREKFMWQFDTSRVGWLAELVNGSLAEIGAVAMAGVMKLLEAGRQDSPPRRRPALFLTYAAWVAVFRDPRQPAKPRPANPTSIIAQVEGSGTAPPMARSKPKPPGPSATSV